MSDRRQLARRRRRRRRPPGEPLGETRGRSPCRGPGRHLPACPKHELLRHSRANGHETVVLSIRGSTHVGGSWRLFPKLPTAWGWPRFDERFQDGCPFHGAGSAGWYTARGQELRELVRWPSEAVDCQPVPTASEGHRTKPQIVTACGI